MNDKGPMKISELVQSAGVPASTIRFYIKEGLLPAPIKTGKTSAYYSKTHLERITYIKEQTAEKKSLASIKEEMSLRFPQTEEQTESCGKVTQRRDDIIRSAIELFLSKGYGETSIADIVDHTHISKMTFYQHFKNKEELLIACADKIFYAMYADVWNEIRMEHNMIERFRKRGKAFLASYPKWLDMMNLVRSLSLSENPVFKVKYDEVLSEILSPIVHDIDRLQSEGHLRQDIDTTLAGYITMGMAEFAAELVHRGICSEQEVIDSLETIFRSGLLKK